MADQTRRNEGARPEHERQGVREPQPIGGRADLESRREHQAADIARANEGRGAGNPPSGTVGREPVRGSGERAGGMMGRMRSAWNRLRKAV